MRIYLGPQIVHKNLHLHAQLNLESYLHKLDTASLLHRATELLRHAEKNYNAMIADSGHNGYFSPLVNALS